MQANENKKPQHIANEKSKQDSASSSASLQQKIQGLQSNELIIALSGPVGSGRDTVLLLLQEILKQAKYEVMHIKLSALIKQNFEKLKASNPEPIKEAGLENLKLDSPIGYTRTQDYMTAGDFLRKFYGKDFLAQVALNEINKNRIKSAEEAFRRDCPADPKNPSQPLYGGQPIGIEQYAMEHFPPPKTVYILDQLKNPEEAKLLRAIYGDLFYLLGTLCNEQERRKNLQKSMSEAEANILMDRDKQATESHGQQLEKTLQLSDYFLRSSQNDRKHLRGQIQRFINVVHGREILTPTEDEYGMYLAYSASLKSACLSRQVGASIADKNGTVIATGCNDVPKFGGGLYTSESNQDHRCYNKEQGICFNDDYKTRLIKNRLAEILDVKLKASVVGATLPTATTAEIAEEMFSQTRIKDLIEFSRAIHAEMDAIISLARKGGPSTKQCTMYTTTYPCHNCARHIVAAGIIRVVFIEPYEKSLAVDLHGDAIKADGEDVNHRVEFAHFEGVSPRKYQHFFKAHRDRKDKEGKLISQADADPLHKTPEFLYSYRVMEGKAIEHLNDVIQKGEAAKQPQLV